MDWFTYVVIGLIVAVFGFIVVRNTMTKGRTAMKPGEFKDKDTSIQDTTHG